MAGKWCDEGENDILDVYFSNDQVHRTSLFLGLYSNTTEPAEDATLAVGITEIPVANGYARIEILDTEWTIAADLATAVEKTFAATGSWGNCYGYFLCTVASGTAGLLLAVEHFSNGPYNIQNDGDQIKITSKVTAS